MKKINCREYGGFGHVKAQCANTLNNKGKPINVRWSDESEGGMKEEHEEGLSSHHTLFSTMMKIVEECTRSNIVGNYVVTSFTSFTSFEESDNKYGEVTERDLLMAYELMLKDLIR